MGSMVRADVCQHPDGELLTQPRISSTALRALCHVTLFGTVCRSLIEDSCLLQHSTSIEFLLLRGFNVLLSSKLALL